VYLHEQYADDISLQYWFPVVLSGCSQYVASMIGGWAFLTFVAKRRCTHYVSRLTRITSNMEK
jgi:hypothetical protein